MFRSIQKFLLALALVAPMLSQAVPSVVRLPQAVPATAATAAPDDNAMTVLALADPAATCATARASTRPGAHSVAFLQGDKAPVTSARSTACRYICQACSQFGWPDACARCATCGGNN